MLPSVANYLALARLIDGDYSAAFAEIDRGLALEESDIPFLRSGVAIAREASTADPPMKTGLSFWAAYFQEPELALALWTEGTRTPDTLWQPLMREVRSLPAFKDVVRELGLVDYWSAYGWSDFCYPIDGEDFACR